MGDALSTVAKQFPDTNFAIVDFPWAALKDKPQNAVASCSPSRRRATSSASPPRRRRRRLGERGRRPGRPGCRRVPGRLPRGREGHRPGHDVLQGYSQDFVDQAKCKELALTQITRGSKAVFAAAGGCGLGALQAAKERNAWGIGVDNDQAFLGPFMLTSATKKVDVAVYDTIQSEIDDKFEGGTDSLFDVANGGVGYGKVSADAPDRDALIEKLDDVSKQIATARSTSRAGSTSALSVGSRALESRDDARAPASPRDEAHHEAVPGDRRQRRRQLRPAARARCMRCSARTAPASRR